MSGIQPTHDEEAVFQEHLEFFKKTVQDIVDQRLNLIQNSTDRECFLDYLIAHWKTINTSKNFLRDEAITNFVGGFHTTGNLLTWLIYYIASNKPVQERLRSEANSMDISTTPIRKFKYHEAVLKETLRLSILAPFAGRCSDEEITIAGYTVPPATPIVLALGVSFIDPNNGWIEPEKFNPDRFLDSHPNSKIKFSPFGFAGGRVCPGYNYTYYFGILLLHSIVKNFKLDIEGDGKPERIYGLVTKPDKKISVKFFKV